METYIPASSPLIDITPCDSCSDPQYIDDGAGGYSAQLSGGSLAVSFTGTGIMLNHTSSSQSNLTFAVNGSTVDPSSPITQSGSSFSLTHFALPYGRHEFVTTISSSGNSTAGAEPDSVIHGYSVQTGMVVSDSTTNVTIDDKAWRMGQISLSDGWNMLETPVENSNWIDTESVMSELTTLGNDSDGSISFTRQAGSSMAISFTGQAVWAYGISGGEAGLYGVQLDNGPMQVVNAAKGPKAYGSLLYMVTDLSAGNHTLTFTNIELGKRFSFDRLVAINGISLAATPPLTTTTSPSSSTTGLADGAITYGPGASSSNLRDGVGGPGGHALPDIDHYGALSKAAIAGITIAGLAVATVAGFILYWLVVRHRRRQPDAEAKRRTTFLNISDSQLGKHSRKRKNFSRIHSPNEKDEPFAYRAEHEQNRFPGLRTLGAGAEVKRKKSFLDMDMSVEVEPEADADAVEGDRRLMPLNHASMAGVSPLTELVRCNPHDTPGPSSFERTYARHHFHRPSDGASHYTGLSTGTGPILPPNLGSTTAPAWSRPSGPGGAL